MEKINRMKCEYPECKEESEVNFNLPILGKVFQARLCMEHSFVIHEQKEKIIEILEKRRKDEKPGKVSEM